MVHSNHLGLLFDFDAGAVIEPDGEVESVASWNGEHRDRHIQITIGVHARFQCLHGPPYVGLRGVLVEDGGFLGVEVGCKKQPDQG